jgi:hypothetical protein
MLIIRTHVFTNRTIPSLDTRICLGVSLYATVAQAINMISSRLPASLSPPVFEWAPLIE